MQLAAVEALKQGPEWFKDLNEEYRRRRVLAGEIFDLVGAAYDKDSTGMFLWGKVAEGTGEQVSDKILYEAGVFITPGFIFGKNGSQYIRISLCAKPEVLAAAKKKIEKIW